MEKNIQDLLQYSMGVVFNTNDFFAPCDTDITKIDYDDLVWVMPIFQKYGYEGLKACFSYIREKSPLPQHISLNFKLAYLEIEHISPNVCS